MKIRSSLASTVFLIAVLAFFYLFAPAYFIRYFSLFVVGVIIVAFLYSRVIPSFIAVSHTEKIIRGIKLQEMAVEITVKNRSFLPIPYFTVDDAPGELFTEGNSFLVSLKPFQEKKVQYRCKGHQRGKFTIGPVNLKGSDPFGMYPWQRSIDTRMTAIVYPSIYPMDLINNQGLPSGNININDRMYEDVTQFRSLREYVPGDDMKRINWKASAKTTKLYTMEFDSTLYFPVLIVLNFCFDDYPVRFRNQQIERAAEVAASLAFYYADLKQEIGMVTSGTVARGPRTNEEGDYVSVQRKSGYEHAQELLEVVAKLKSVRGNADFSGLLFHAGSSIPMGTRVFVITPPVSESQAQSLISARRRGMNIQVMQIESSSERKTEDFIRGALRVVAIKELSQETIYE